MNSHFPRICAVALLAGSLANAAVIHDNGAPDQSFGNNIAEFIQADDFNVAADSTLTSVRFWTLQEDIGDYLGSIDWFIYNDAVGEPGTTVASGNAAATQTATGATGLGLTEYRYDFNISVPVTAGTYWLGIHNGDVGTTNFLDINWESTAAGGGNPAGEFDLLFGDPFFANNTEKAFIINGDPQAPPPPGIPEPGSVILISAGLAFIALRRRVA